MAEVANDSVNPDIGLLRDINNLAKQAPRGVDQAVEFMGDYGLIALMAVLAGWCWWRIARRSADAPAAVAGVLWAVLAAGIALLVNIPVRALVRRPRPFDEYDGLYVLVHHHGGGSSFVSAHSTLTAALAIGLFVVSRKIGVIAILLALAEGFTCVYLGVHYPTDVIGGFALGAATTLLLAPLALALLTSLTRTVSASRARPLVQAASASPRPTQDARPPARQSADDTGLAA